MICSHRLRPLVVSLATAFSLLGAAPALAAQRYVSVGSTDTTGSCTQAAPCRIDHGVNDAAAGDEVIVAPGDYKVTTALQADVPIDIHGVDGKGAPLLQGAASLDSETLALDAGGSVSHVNIEGITTDNPTLSLQGATGDDLRVRSANQDAVVLKSASGSPTILRDAVANSKGNDGNGVLVEQGSGSGSVSIVNVTALGNTALLVDGSGPSVSVRNSILQGDSKDIDANGGTSADVDFSNFRPEQSSDYVDGGHNQSAAPVFLDDTHREAAGSPTIDAGTADAPDLGAFDPVGHPRIIGSAPDIGAFEYDAGDTSTDAGDSGDLGTDGTGAAGAAGGSVLPPPVPPTVGKTVQVSEESGSVLVRLPGTTTFIPLGDAASIPMGSIIDATNGVVSLTSVRDGSGTLQTGQFWGGMFRVFQQKSSHPITELRLVDTGLGKCRGGS
jgi:hypothetical protein